MASTKITRTSSASSEKKLTISYWIKRSTTGEESVIGNTNDGSNWSMFYFNGANKLQFASYVGGSYVIRYTTNRTFSDVGAWYHLVATVDTSLSSPEVKVYVNGEEQTSLQYNVTPSQNADIGWFNAWNFEIGVQFGSSYYLNGSLADLYYIQGYIYPASTFGESDSVSGIWKPQTNPNINYGGNGGNSCHLKFENSGNMDLDSGSNNISFTTTGTLTQNVDTPSNNFITINPLDNYYPACTFSNGNTTVATGNNYSYCQSTIYVNTGKYYWEVKAVSKSSGADEFMIGIQGKSATATNSPAQSNNGITYYKDGDTYGFGGGATSYGNSYTVGDIIGVALDCDNNKLYFSKNGTWQNSGDPTSGATGTGALAITDPNDVPQGGYSPVGGAYTNVSHTLSFNFGQGYFGTTAVASANADANGVGKMEYAVPSGYYTLNTKNLKEFG